MGRRGIWSLAMLAGILLGGTSCSDLEQGRSLAGNDAAGSFVESTSGQSSAKGGESRPRGARPFRNLSLANQPESGDASIVEPPSSAAEIQRRQRRAGPSYDIERGADGGFQGTGRNLAHEFRVVFRSTSPWIHSPGTDRGTADDSEWRVGLQFARLGRGDRMRRAPAITQRTIESNRVAFRRGSQPHIEEWYLNGPLGLEQGFVLGTRPAGPADAPLVLEIAVEGSLRAVRRGDDAIALKDDRDRTRLVYRDLFVRDAQGNEVAATMEVRDGRIRLVVEDAGVPYPIEVDPTIGATQVITTSAKGAKSVYAADVDGDSDTDVLSASAQDDTIAWYENDGSENFTSHKITTTAASAWSVHAADIDGDSDTDVLSASFGDDTIAWYENNGSQKFTTRNVTTSADYARSVYAEDVDGDTDIDVLSASADDHKIAWYENCADSDGDGICDGNDNCPSTSNGPQADTDTDGDGVCDVEDDCPNGPGETDTDGDGTCDAEDACPNGPGETDSDGDGTCDADDACPMDANADTDTDGDGVCDVDDVCPEDAGADGDTDGDGLADCTETDADLDPSETDTDGDTIPDGEEYGTDDASTDTDGDGTGDALDHDSDGDGWSDMREAGDDDPATPPVDTDGDGTPDYRDGDSDGDGIEDGADNCRIVENEDQIDTDGNGTGDVCAGDIDGDGVADEEDNCPKVRNDNQTDTDGDDTGNPCDSDADGDGVNNEVDTCPLTANAAQEDDDGDGLGNACDQTSGTGPDVGIGDTSRRESRTESGCRTAGGGAPGFPSLPMAVLVALGAAWRMRRRRESVVRRAVLLAMAGGVVVTSGCFPSPASIEYRGPAENGDAESSTSGCSNSDGLGETCRVGEGQCRRSGIRICDGDSGEVTCSVVPGEPSDEICDGRDNDCDGVIDERDANDDEMTLKTTVAHCGRCEVSCEGRFAQASAACREGGCVIDSCAKGFGDANEIAGDGCECEEIAETDETCDHVDDDCDGEIDEDCMSGAEPAPDAGGDTGDTWSNGDTSPETDS